MLRGPVKLLRAPSSLSAIATAGLLCVISAATASANTSIFAPASTPARSIYELSLLVLGITAVIFVLVGGILAFTVVRYRHRPGDEDGDPPQVYGSNSIELAWTVIPILTVLVLFLVTTRTIVEVQSAVAPPGALEVTVVGRQWWWEFRYPELGVVTANELHIPVSEVDDRRPTYLDLESDDVIHSFWVPRLAGKVDVVPNRDNRMWVEPFETGTFLGQCAEYCGTQHANMLLRVVVHTREDFERWVAEQRKPPVEDSSVRDGREIFFTTACVSCHTVGESVADGRFGPDLTHLMSRETIGAGVAANTRENLRDWIADPDHLKPGVLMPAMKLDDHDLDRLVAYLVTLE